MILSRSGAQARINQEIVEVLVLHVADDNMIDLLVDQSRDIYVSEDYGLIKEVAIKGYPQEGNHRIYRLLPDARYDNGYSEAPAGFGEIMNTYQELYGPHARRPAGFGEAWGVPEAAARLDPHRREQGARRARSNDDVESVLGGNRFEFFRNMDNIFVVFQTFDERNYSDSQIASMSFMTRLAPLIIKRENESSPRLSTELTQLGRGLRPFEKGFKDEFFDLQELQITTHEVERRDDKQAIFKRLGLLHGEFGHGKRMSINAFLMFIRSDRIPAAFRVSVGELQRQRRETYNRNIELDSSGRYANWRPPARRIGVQSSSPQPVRQQPSLIPLLEQQGELQALASEIAANGYFESLPEPLASRVWRAAMPRHGRSWKDRLSAANEILAREDSRFKSLRAQATEIVASEDFERLREPLRSEVQRAVMSQNGKPWSNRVDAVYEILDRYV